MIRNTSHDCDLLCFSTAGRIATLCSESRGGKKKELRFLQLPDSAAAECKLKNIFQPKLKIRALDNKIFQRNSKSENSAKCDCVSPLTRRSYRRMKHEKCTPNTSNMIIHRGVKYIL